MRHTSHHASVRNTGIVKFSTALWPYGCTYSILYILYTLPIIQPISSSLFERFVRVQGRSHAHICQLPVLAYVCDNNEVAKQTGQLHPGQLSKEKEELPWVGFEPRRSAF